ncbi:MAG: hypothetical protein J6V54_06615 [Bacteroidales bacterium]|nr:hypothetical protein [Bacteroidales bacterium]
MKKICLKFALLALAVVGMFSVSSCEKGEETCSECHCQVENPLTDLGWLKDKLAEYDNSYSLRIKVYTCKYQTNKDGFFFEEVEMSDGQQYLYDCKGNLLCTTGGISGRLDDVYNVDYNSFQLIYTNL